MSSRPRVVRPSGVVGAVTIAATMLTATVFVGGTVPVEARGPAEADRLVTLELVSDAPGSLAAGAAVVLAHGGDVLGEAPGVLLVEVPASATERLGAVVDGDVRDPVEVDVRPEHWMFAPATFAPSTFTPETFGPTAGAETGITNAAAWQAAGLDGSGVRIGVIDFFDVTNYWNEDEHGPLPVGGVNALCLEAGGDCTSQFFDGVDLGGEDHGVAVVEIIRDMAPGAEIFIGQAATIADYDQLIDWFVANDVQVVNRSLGSRFDGPGDGRGLLDGVVADAVGRGILWVNSGGNNGQGRYYRHQVRLVGNRVAFGPTGTETFLRMTGCVALGGVRWANDWDKSAGDRTDYDVYLWESPTGAPATGSVIDSSTQDQRAGADALETQIGSFCPDPGSSLYLEVRWNGGDVGGDVLEILDYGSGIASFTQRPYSAAVSVVDARQPGVLGVGAIDPPDGGVIAAYSSQGPTNDGRIAPQIAAPSGFANTIYGTFSGTSASAPVVAGGAALLVGAGLAAAPNPLGDLIRNLTVDRGPAGPDQLYGYGEFRLPDPPAATGVDQTPSRFVALGVPTRLLDTRPATAIGPSTLIGELWRGEILELPILGVAGIPTTGVTAVAVNLVSVSPDRSSYLQALPTRQAAVGGYANLNVDTPAENRSNFAVIPVGDDGTISIYSIAEGHVVVDVLGWFEATSGDVAAGRFVEFADARRLLDTRVDAPATPLAAGQSRTVPMPSAGIVADPDDIEALVVTVVAVDPTQQGWLQAYPADRPDVIGETATINVRAGSNVANTAIVPVGKSGIGVTGNFAAGGTSHVVVDAIGYITSSAAPVAATGRFVPVRPNRAFDSRTSIGPLDDAQIVLIDASDAADVTVPDDASGVIWNLVIVAATRGGYSRGWAPDRPEPVISSLNWKRPGETRASAAVTAVESGSANFRVEDGTVDLPSPIGDLVADVFGYFT